MNSFREQARQLDREDILGPFRSRFVDPDASSLVYLDGNSLGRLPAETEKILQRTVRHEWGERLIRSWNEGWIDLPLEIGGRIATLVGAGQDEVILADATSVNLFKLAVAALLAQPGRRKIVTDDLNFPSDLYILRQAAQLIRTDLELVVVPSADGIHGAQAQLLATIDEDTALVSLSHVTYKSGFLHDMPIINQHARAVGALTLWDLSHSVGAVPIDLSASGSDMAVGCTYKYLNGGPGAPAFLYVRRDLQSELDNPVPGWMGHRALFDFEPEYVPAPDIRRFLSGTPPVISMRAIATGVDLILEAGMPAIRSKSLQMGTFLQQMWQSELAHLGFYLNSPANAEQRGSHLALGHEEGRRIDLALIAEMGILPDFREPDTIRLGMAPLYTSYGDLVTAVEGLRTVVVEKRYERIDRNPGRVT